jgi:hypothetical protein
MDINTLDDFALEELTIFGNSKAYLIIKRAFEKHLEVLKLAAFNSIPTNDVEKIRHGNRQGQKAMMDYIEGLPVRAKEILEKRKKERKA